MKDMYSFRLPSSPNGSVANAGPISYRLVVRTSLVLVGLLLGITSRSQAQVYYTLNDGSATSNADQLRRINLDGSNDALVKSGFVNIAGPVVLDAANNRLLVADVRPSQQTTSLTNTRIVAVSLASGNPVSTLITPTAISGAASTVIGGLTLDRVNNYLYYTLNDGGATTTTDQLRRINLDGTDDRLIKSGFVNIAGPVVLDAANNRLLVADVRPSQQTTSLTNTRIVAVSLASGNPVSTLITPTAISGAASTVIGGLALDRVNNYLYYTLNDGGATTTTDQLRRINLDGTDDRLIRDNFANIAGQLVLDAANNRLLAVDARPSQQTTSLTNAKIVAVSLASGNPVSTLITATPVSTTSTTVAGLAIADQDPATVTTATVTAFGSNSATLGGNVTSDGGVTVTERGVVYSSTNTLPTTTSGTKQAIGNGTGSFSQTVSGLTGNTTYYVRAYATNALTTSYGAVQTFTTPVPNSAPTNITLSASSVAENQPVNTAVGIFSTTDADAGQTFSYALVSGTGSTDNALFQLVGNQLRTNAVFDYETKSSYTIRVQTTDSGTPALSYQKSFTVTITNNNELAVTVTSQTNVSCNGGSSGAATLTASGESAPFTYTYRNTTTNTTLPQTGSSVNGLTAGVYSATVTASGFSVTTSFTITQPTALSLTSSRTNVTTLSGSDGTATVTVSGGTPGYTYDWTPGNPTGDGTSSVSSLSAGTYQVTVADANGCTAATSVTVATASDLTLTLYARPSTVYGSSPMTVIVTLSELNNVTTSGLITVRVSKDAAANLTFNPTLTTLGGRTVQNGSWSFTSDDDYYSLTTTQAITAGGDLSFGLSGTLTPANKAGITNVGATLMQGSGGEIRMTNNSDADKIDYFP